MIIGLFYTDVIFMIFPVHNAIGSLDTNQIEAARDFGAPHWRVHWRVVMPHAKPGIGSGCIMVFMLWAGSILVQSLLGSTTSRWFTEVIQQWFFKSVDWKTGSACAFLLLVLCTAFVSLRMRLLDVRLVDMTGSLTVARVGGHLWRAGLSGIPSIPLFRGRRLAGRLKPRQLIRKPPSTGRSIPFTIAASSESR